MEKMKKHKREVDWEALDQEGYMTGPEWIAMDRDDFLDARFIESVLNHNPEYLDRMTDCDAVVELMGKFFVVLKAADNTTSCIVLGRLKEAGPQDQVIDLNELVKELHQQASFYGDPPSY